MIKKILTLFLMSVSVAINAQSGLDINNIKKSNNYFWGQSQTCDTYDKAKSKAMELMYENIIENYDAHPIDLGIDDFESHMDKIMLTLDKKISYKRKIYNVVRDTKNDKYECLAYISKADFDEVCKERAADIQKFAEIGMAKESDHNMTDALRAYYWGMLSCVAHPYGKTLKITVDDEEVMAYNYLYDRAVEALGTFTFSISKDNPGEFNDEGISVIMNVRADDNEVSGLQVKYYNGVDDYVKTMIDNGKMEVLLLSHDAREFDFKIEYDFSHHIISHPEMKVIMDNIDKIIIKENVGRDFDITPYIKYIDGTAQKEAEEKAKAEAEAKADTVAETETGAEVEAEMVAEADVESGAELAKAPLLTDDEMYFLRVMKEVEDAFRAKNYSSVSKYFTKESYAMLDTLVRNAEISVIGNQQYELITVGNTTVCRDIDMKFQFRNYVSFIREVVFRFDNETKLISSLAFRLSSIAENDIATKNRWNNDCKMALVNFLEDYQTAYALKRYDYLESIFSDDALFIVGHVLKKNENELKDIKQFKLPAEEVELLRMDKNTYFERLSKVFLSQEYINIRFTETDFKRQLVSDDEENAKGEDIFGVRLLQEYHSTTYGDVGYLFLMVDLRDVKRPVIHVRAWQPDKVDINKLVTLKDLE